MLGSLRDVRQVRIGLVVVLAGAAIVVYNVPGHPAGQLVFIPILFGICWLAGLVLRERAEQAKAAQVRATEAEQEREAATRMAVAEERARIARELRDIVAHAVSVMVLQVGAVRHKLPDTLAEDRRPPGRLRDPPGRALRQASQAAGPRGIHSTAAGGDAPELAALNDALPELDWLRITDRKSGAIKLTPLDAQPGTRNLRRLKKAVQARWGPSEPDQRCRMLTCGAYIAAIAVIVAYGTRIPGPVLRLVLNNTVVLSPDHLDLDHAAGARQEGRSPAYRATITIASRCSTVAPRSKGKLANAARRPECRCLSRGKVTARPPRLRVRPRARRWRSPAPW